MAMVREGDKAASVVVDLQVGVAKACSAHRGRMFVQWFIDSSATRCVLRSLCVAIVALSSCAAWASEWVEEAKLGRLFAQAGVVGTFVLYDAANDRLSGFDRERAERRFVPASTYKIPHTLIGLSVGAVSSVDEVLPYGGQAQPFPQWERDMSLRDAIAMSNVAIYRELARRIGLQPMQAMLTRLGYGNASVGDDIGNFWLKGPLMISAVEQTQFLDRLRRDVLPFPAALRAEVRDILLLDRGEGWALYGKTGWQNAPDPGTGWWVGWVRRDDVSYTFALNIDVRRKADADKRIELGKACLRELGVL